ncbi:hypothetical protein AAZX31_20G217200 [Glycine max]|uniref:FAF domain-containing protein n=1 Tax=Glycine max TaxID=3847 RepID=C6TA54_SOYBN|nr:FAF domain-containing protein [Glycine max]ACU18706.1 unknown [Glycine max]KAG4908574.1 hypothetical protein JHK86_057058 [Glycine max]KAG5075888.1 hypothetical protein JHK84_057119 [Glycine max]KAG5078541.1 hypothetical protein JHK82_057236 [Glycine max]KAH1037575.1 hypothetical protein GYH30_056764 [Glycine max]|eukprot:NP_001240900.1 FAF domain-containing protein [Glycine max]
MVFFLYVPILLSLSFSFLLHVFKKHIHISLLDLVTTFNSTNIMIDNYKLYPNQIGFIEDVSEGIEGFMTCTKNLGFQSIDISDKIDDNDNNNDDEDEDNCWRKTRVTEGKGNFPPPLSSLNGNGQPSFILVPVRKNGRLQLSKVRIKKPKILYATRQDGRLKLFLVPDQCVKDNAQEDEKEQEQELVDDMEEHTEEEEGMMIVESMEEEEEEDDDEVVEEITYYEQKDFRIGEWKFPNERSRKCHEVLNHIQSHHHHHGHGSHHHLHMYGFSIA